MAADPLRPIKMELAQADLNRAMAILSGEAQVLIDEGAMVAPLIAALITTARALADHHQPPLKAGFFEACVLDIQRGGDGLVHGGASFL
jgi:hypothetical protein